MPRASEIEVPPPFARSTIAREGDAGRAWIERLPTTVGRLLDLWSLELDGGILHGYTAIVVPVRRAGPPSGPPSDPPRGSPRDGLMLKVRWLDASTRQEGLALRAWAGRGAVRLIDEEHEAGALLLERLDPARSLDDAPRDEAVAVAAELLRRLAIPAPDTVRTIREEVAELADGLPRLWERAGRPFPRSRLDGLAESARELSRTDDRLLVNHDLHYDNVLGGSREPWLAIDPKVVAGDVEYGVAQLLWNRIEELDGPAGLQIRLRAIVDHAELDDERTRLWSVVRLAEAWLWAQSVGDRALAGNCRRLLEWLGWEGAG